jgi:putative cell wall-binding protein
MQPLVAVVDGKISFVKAGGVLAGNMVELHGDDGWTYSYLHLNDDTPGTDDGAAALTDTLGPGIEVGARVTAGQLIGYLGDSGNAEETAPHLHFEMKTPDGVTVNAYASLQAAGHEDEAAGAADVEPSPIQRIAGIDRVATAVAASVRGWPQGSDAVVVAAGDRYAEALPASVLAASLHAPLLLTVGDDAPAAVVAELDRLHARRVTVIGSVTSAAASTLGTGGRVVSRLGVAGDATATAAAIASTVGGGSGVAVVVNDARFADGVSAAGVAAAQRWPILLATSTTVPQKTVDAWRALGVHRIVLVGGTSVLSSSIEAFVTTAGRCGDGPGCQVQRLAGADRYATSVAAAQQASTLASTPVTTVLLDTGTTYPDALTSGALAARLGALVLLVDGTGAAADAAARTFLGSLRLPASKVAILGGSSAVSPAADRAVQSALASR